MNRIDQIFATLRAEDRRALMPFVTAGFPTMQATAAVLPALQRAGAAICEVGFPFSDPVADGPVIQDSMAHALSAGVGQEKIFRTIRELRQRLDLGLVAMVSYSIAYRIGVDRFVERAREAGFDGFIFPDLPLEEAGAVRERASEARMSCSLLIAPTTPGERARRIAEASTGFVYLIARMGITGTSRSSPVDLEQRVGQLREVTDLPVAVGFGVSTPEHVRAVTRTADAVIVGSALVRRMAQHVDDPPQHIAGHVETFVRELSGGLTVEADDIHATRPAREP